MSTHTNNSPAASTAPPRLDGCATTYGTDKIIHENDCVWTIDSPLPRFNFGLGIKQCEIGGSAGVHAAGGEALGSQSAVWSEKLPLPPTKLLWLT